MIVNGENVVLEIRDAGIWYEVLCATGCSIQVRQSTVLKTGPNSGAWEEKVARRSSWTASVTGGTRINNESGVVTFFWTLLQAVRLATRQIRMTFDDTEGNSKQISGNAIITLSEANSSFGEFTDCRIEFEGTGAISLGDVEPPVPLEEDVFSDWWQTVNGQNYIEGASSGESDTGPITLNSTTDEIIHVSVEGGTFYQVSTVILSTDFTFSSDRITFTSGLVFDGSQRVSVVIKRTV